MHRLPSYLIISTALTFSPVPGHAHPLSTAPPPHISFAITETTPLHGTVTVRAGDTLSSIAKDRLGSAKLWPVLWWDNRTRVSNPSVLLAGQKLRYGTWRRVRAWLRHAALHAIPAPSPTPAPAGSPAAIPQPAAAAAPVSVSGYSGFQACVIARESGGNPGIWNASGHWGLYQFAASTWAAYGGNPDDFGSAGVTEQNQVFANAMAAGGQSNWAPYDGC